MTLTSFQMRGHTRALGPGLNVRMGWTPIRRVEITSSFVWLVNREAPVVGARGV